jgi:hypothetical protein
MLLAVVSNSQTYHKKYEFYTQKEAVITPENIRSDFDPVLIHNAYNRVYNAGMLAPTKQNQSSNRNDFKTINSVSEPVYIDGFQSAFDGNDIPNDNDMAISNDGKIIAVRNSRIGFYDDTIFQIHTMSLGALVYDLGLVEPKYDPRVIYDQDEDRFIVVLLNGFDSQTSKILLAFSQTNDPMGEWNIYSVEGNILNDNTWSDYPIIGINNNELFVSVTNFGDSFDFEHWDFYHNRIVQVNKFDGYNGEDSIHYAYHTFNPGWDYDMPMKDSYFSLCPVKGGKTLYGPNMYFISAKDCSQKDSITGEYPENDSLFLIEFTGKHDDAEFEINSWLLQLEKPYSMTISTDQPGSKKLLTNYNTMQDAFYDNDFIHFVFNSKGENGKPSVYHGIIESVGNLNSVSVNYIEDNELAFAYPSIVYTGSSQFDQSACIFFNHVSDNVYPGNSCVKYDNGSYSDVVRLKEGESSMDLTYDNAERWGDYTGCQIKHNDPSYVWTCGSYGYLGSTHTWISKVHIEESEFSVEENNNNNMNIKLFPNPSADYVCIEFTIDIAQICSFSLYSSKGEKTTMLLKDKVKRGENLFKFNTLDLASGMYFLKIEGDKGFTFTSPLVIE